MIAWGCVTAAHTAYSAALSKNTAAAAAPRAPSTAASARGRSARRAAMSSVARTFVLTESDQKGVPKSMMGAAPKAAPGFAVSTSRPMPVAGRGRVGSGGGYEEAIGVPIAAR